MNGGPPDPVVKYEQETSNLNECFTTDYTFTANMEGLYEFFWTDFTDDSDGTIETSLLVFRNATQTFEQDNTKLRFIFIFVKFTTYHTRTTGG